jgi:acetylornithine deacetylase/succinyl-diaminopimelate desuccinylase-like protein
MSLTPAEKKRRHRNERIAATLLILVLGSAVFAFLVWNAREEEAVRRDRSYIPKQQEITPEILLLQEYVRIPTTPGREAAGARWIVALLERNGIRAEVIESAPGRPNVYARIKGRERGNGLLLLQHLDVVEANAKDWQRPPFSGEIAQNMLHGRGALDMKGIGLCQLLAFIDLARSGRTPQHDVALLAAADEERGGALGVGWLVEHRPALFEGIRYAINEGGITEMRTEAMTYFGIEVGNKQYLALELRAPAIEPLVALRLEVQPSLTRREPDKILPEVRRYFRDVAPTRIAFRELLADVDRGIADGEFWRMPVAYRQLTQNTVRVDWPYESDGGYAAAMHLFNLPEEDPDERIAWARRLAARHGATVRVTVRNEATPISPADTPLFRLIASLASQTYDTRAGTLILHRSTNDSRFLRRRGIVCYGVSPYPVDFFQAESIHGVDERIRLDWFMQGVGFMRRLVRGWALAAQ